MNKYNPFILTWRTIQDQNTIKYIKKIEMSKKNKKNINN